MSREEEQKLVEIAASNLGEQFDSVQILVSIVEGGKTRKIQKGVGNWYARQGMAHEFINMDIAEDAAILIAERLSPLNPPDDDWKKTP